VRRDGYAPIADYAAIGDGRASALVARDGSVDWFAFPRLDSAPVFFALVDAHKGGRFELGPQDDYSVSREYLAKTNVLTTTFETRRGRVRVIDALSLHELGLLPWVELVRRIECLSGSVAMRWRLIPRFDWGARETRLVERRGTTVAIGEGTELALHSWNAGEPEIGEGEARGSFTIEQGKQALLALTSAHAEPTPIPRYEDVLRRLETTATLWGGWLSSGSYQGAWAEALERSALVLRLLTYAPSGGIAAALTTSLPERIGADRNYDYRFGWVRDSALTLDALINVGLRAQVHESFAWLLHATERTHPELRPCYRLDGRTLSGRERELELEGFRGSRPVREGNRAAMQLQLGAYGDLLETAELYVREGNAFDEETSGRICELIDELATLWRGEDAGLWELDEQQHYTTSKLGAWTAFERALRLVEEGQLPPKRADEWRLQAKAVRRFILDRCWSNARGSFVMYPGTEKLDAGVLRIVRTNLLDPKGAEVAGTIDAIRTELSAGGPLLYRYSGQQEVEGAFVACSFWLIEALARAGRLDEARATMEAMVALANDVGLFAEEIDPQTNEHVGNFPQGLSHLALVNAAAAIAEDSSNREAPKGSPAR
jgi:GH15 family glucan-1,4-alpha-glucosidase